MPLKKITSSKIVSGFESVVVSAVDTIGDWMMLSIETRTFAFWLVDINLWEVPIPTEVISTTSGIALSAFSALVAIWMLLSSYLTT